MSTTSRMTVTILTVAFWVVGQHSAMAADRVPVGGHVHFLSIPACALVLANGQSDFSCDGSGRFDMNVPLDSNGMVTVQAFATGFSRFSQVLTPEQAREYEVQVRQGGFGGSIQVNRSFSASAREGWAHISGTVVSRAKPGQPGGLPVCGLILANGQRMFSCGDSLGKFSLEAPLDSKGHITLMVFATDFHPYEEDIVVAGNEPSGTYSIAPLGLLEGQQPSQGIRFANDLNSSGQVIGETGSRAWLYTNGIHDELGWTDFTAGPADAWRSSYAVDVNDRGQVIGHTQITWSEEDGFSAGLDDGITVFQRGSSWLYSEGAYFDTGLVFTGNSYNILWAKAVDLNEAGQATGTSHWSRQAGDKLFFGSSAWLYRDGTSHDISLLDTENTFEAGAGLSTPHSINNAGDVVGTTLLPGFRGSSCWLYNEGTTFAIGMKDAEHTREPTSTRPEFRSCNSPKMNENAEVIGNSGRYHPSHSDSGSTAWLFRQGVTTNIGMTDEAHTSPDGYRFSVANSINNAGQVAGWANKYSPGVGQSAWLFESDRPSEEGVARTIGWTDPEHTRFDGAQYSNLSNDKASLNERGQVIGYSVRYDSSSELLEQDLGRSAWIYGFKVLRQLGLIDAYHTDSDGTRYSEATVLNEAGQAAGYSKLYGDKLRPAPCPSPFCDARTAWFYNPAFDQIIPLALSYRSDGFTYNDIIHIDEDGMVTGYYMAFENGSDAFDFRLFSFSLESGLHDIAVVDEGKWEASSPPYLANDSGHFVGSARFEGSQDPVPYLLTPIPGEGENQNK
jgi:hypothetical protein